MMRAKLTGFLVITIGVLLSSCANSEALKTSSSQKSISQEALKKKTTLSLIKNDVTPSKQTPAIAVNWQNVEALAEKVYQGKSVEELMGGSHLAWENDSRAISSYAKAYNVSLAEARRRLTLMSFSSAVMGAVEEDLGEASLMSYYINDDPNEFRVGVTTLDTVLAERYVYKFKHSGSTDYSLPIYIYPVSDKTLAQINQLIADAKPEILKRYPYTWLNHYDPVKNAVDIYISFHPSKLPNESERQRIEAELTDLIGHQVALKVNIATYSYRE